MSSMVDPNKQLADRRRVRQHLDALEDRLEAQVRRNQQRLDSSRLFSRSGRKGGAVGIKVDAVLARLSPKLAQAAETREQRDAALRVLQQSSK